MRKTATIAALATAPAPAGIAIVRISGSAAKTALRALFRAKSDPVLTPRRMTYGDLLDHESGDMIDHALAVYMPAPHSYTGEDIAEFHLHGGELLVQKLLRSLFAFGITPAEPGEFTKRAFLNDKLDLVQAEAVCDLINATSEQALKLAGEQLEGRFSKAVTEIGEPLRDALAEIEAALDFPEEEIAPAALDTILKSVHAARKKIADMLKTYAYGHIVKEGFRVLLWGRPNVGKSSILNLLLGRERAIVTDVSGTTRDLIEETALLGGFRFVFCDTAGISETTDRVERIGIELAKERIAWADLVLCVVDAAELGEDWQGILEFLRGKARKTWLVANKIDLRPAAIGAFECDHTVCRRSFYMSATTHDGFASLTQALLREVAGNPADHAQASQIVTNERHRDCLARAADALTRVLDVAAKQTPPEFLSIELRSALAALEELVGATSTEDILGRIFSRFCIGK